MRVKGDGNRRRRGANKKTFACVILHGCKHLRLDRELRMMCKEAVGAYSRFHYIMCLETAGKLTKTFGQDSQCSSRDLKRGPQGHKSGALRLLRLTP
jgi:hypothetical protein